MEQIRALGRQLVASFETALGTLLTYLPGIMLAVVLFLIGWLIASLARRLARGLVLKLQWIVRYVALDSPDDTERFRNALAQVISTIVFWTVALSFAAAALASIDVPTVDEWTARFVDYFPNLLGGIAIIALGFVGATFVRQFIEPAVAGVGIAQASLLGRVSQLVIIVTAFVIGTSQLGIDVTLVVQLLTVGFAAAVAGLALALALGTREHLANLVGTRYLRKHYRVGDRIRVGAHEGRIVAITDGCLFLATDSGDVSIPGSQFIREPFVRVRSGDSNAG